MANEPYELTSLPGRDGLAEFMELELAEVGDGQVVGRVPVSDRVRRPGGIVHGGTYAVLAESICSWATHEAVQSEGMTAMGQANEAVLLRPITEGHVNATARARHRGRTTWVWDVEITDDQGRPCALVRMTVAVRPRRPGDRPS